MSSVKTMVSPFFAKRARARCEWVSSGTACVKKTAFFDAVFHTRSLAVLRRRKPPGCATRVLKSLKSSNTASILSRMRA
ncbi:Uncharacterised protein [Mycobacterium tuberculosis]|nr:Uncharacterised protein [Mycobacterium tuberculosis]